MMALYGYLWSTAVHLNSLLPKLFNSDLWDFSHVERAATQSILLDEVAFFVNYADFYVAFSFDAFASYYCL